MTSDEDLGFYCQQLNHADKLLAEQGFDESQGDEEVRIQGLNANRTTCSR